VWLGFVDSGLPEGDPLPPLPEGCFAVQDVEVAAARLVAHIRRFRPHVLLTYDEKGGYPHPDHIMCHKVSMAAVAMAADPKAVPEAGPAWQVKKVYYHMGGHRNRFMRLDQLMHEHGLEPVYAERLASFPDDQRAYRLTTFIPCADYFSVRDDALRAHATQIDPDGHWFAVPMEIQKMGWPTEDYQLVLSTVPTVIPRTTSSAASASPTPRSRRTTPSSNEIDFAHDMAPGRRQRRPRRLAPAGTRGRGGTRACRHLLLDAPPPQDREHFPTESEFGPNAGQLPRRTAAIPRSEARRCL
jgi:mycothiol conjugate amidase Mca